MSCVLRVSGEHFDVDRFVESSTLVADSLWRKGERRSRLSSNLSTHDSSGVRVIVSAAEMSQLELKTEDATRFLQRNFEAINGLRGFAGVEWIDLDFGAEIRPPGWTSFKFPPELLTLCGDAGISLCLSTYPTNNETASNA